MMRLLVTGGSGYIGTRLMEQLVRRDDVEEIVDVDIKPPRQTLRRVRWVERSVASTR
jgi:nucleoside-diphosphate-sugar epimerase